MKITVTTNHVIEKEIELEFPIYLKHKQLDSVVLFKDEETGGLIIWSDTNISSANTIKDFGLFNEFEPSSKEVFETAFNNTIETLKNLIK